MLFSLVYFLVRRLLEAGGRRQDEKGIELLVLQHQLKVLQRQVQRPRLNRLDRVLLAAASRAMTRSSWSSFVVRPESLLLWHRELVSKKWTYRSRVTPAGRRSSPQSGTSSSGAPIELSRHRWKGLAAKDCLHRQLEVLRDPQCQVEATTASRLPSLRFSPRSSIRTGSRRSRS